MLRFVGYNPPGDVQRQRLLHQCLTPFRASLALTNPVDFFQQDFTETLGLTMWSDQIKIAVWWFGTQLLFFPFSWEFHHPNWRTPSFFRGVGLNHQPDWKICDLSWFGQQTLWLKQHFMWFQQANRGFMCKTYAFGSGHFFCFQLQLAPKDRSEGSIEFWLIKLAMMYMECIWSDTWWFIPLSK